ncbi:MAG: AI-2E family transporter [Paludibacterium sp.]|uniref:AI-2E family transporter n=1 Tax=Paludibacterium sp. TaxID=1917523 RepID=UPI0025CC9A40|nr:AI-2E family transporter [Paludibacterium sp.]MBV8047179.1 AI-2E family transporter [Paludibacterium sp.]MBV8647720.1 AI-2E family transporter [Paludibacterium sp.]
MSHARAEPASHGYAGQIVATGVVLALLYLGRDVLIPITLAVMLSFLIAPLVRKLRHLGLPQSVAVCAAVAALTVGLLFTGMEIGSQVIKIGAAMPQYESTIHDKLAELNQLTLGRLDILAQRADAVMREMAPPAGASAPAAHVAAVLNGSGGEPIPVELHPPRPGPLQLLLNIFNTVSRPLETTGVVLIVLLFILFEQDTLGDRFVRLAGPGNLRATTAAVGDVAQRLSRYFVSQFGVNLAVGAVIWLALALLGLPQAFLWGAMAALLRFVPYIGVWIAGLCATVLAAAIAPGWSQAVLTAAVFLATELLVSQLLEPRLYGHSTGLSPLSVVVSAIFWSALWGPAGLVLSTPLTLCLVVAGRYLAALRFLDILFGDVPSLSQPERFYQRALRGDSHSIVLSARQFLKAQSLGAFCDKVLMPALFMARADFEQQAITDDERDKVNHSVAALLVALAGQRERHRVSVSVLDGESLARKLRLQRERQGGRWQGPLDVPAASVVVVIAVGGELDELAAEVLVWALRAQQIDARRIALDELRPADAAEAPVDIVSQFWLVSAEAADIGAARAAARARLPETNKVMTLSLHSPYAAGRDPLPASPDDFGSYQAAIECCKSATAQGALAGS